LARRWTQPLVWSRGGSPERLLLAWPSHVGKQETANAEARRRASSRPCRFITLRPRWCSCTPAFVWTCVVHCYGRRSFCIFASAYGAFRISGLLAENYRGLKLHCEWVREDPAALATEERWEGSGPRRPLSERNRETPAVEVGQGFRSQQRRCRSKWETEGIVCNR